MKQNNFGNTYPIELNKKVIIIGGMGHGSIIAEVIEDNRRKYNDNEWLVAGFCNDFDTVVDNYKVLGKIKDIPTLLKQGYYFSWGIHLIGRNYKTEDIFNSIDIPDNRWAAIIHKSSFISSSAEIRSGAFVMYGSYIGPRTIVGKYAMIKANVNIGHDVFIEPLCHIAMGANINSNVRLGTCSDVSVGAQVMLDIHIGAHSMLGAQALDMHDIPDGEIHIGVPARFLKLMKKN